MMHSGIWKVKALGWARVFNVLGDVKEIWSCIGFGCNNTKRKRWGYFTFVPVSCGIVLDYAHPRNPSRLRKITDILTRVSDDEYNGTFYYGTRSIFKFKLLRQRNV